MANEIRPLHKAERLAWLKDAKDWLRFHGDNPIPFEDRVTRFAAVAVEFAELEQLRAENEKFHADRAATLLAERGELLNLLKELDALREGCAPDELGAIVGKRVSAFVLRYRAALLSPAAATEDGDLSADYSSDTPDDCDHMEMSEDILTGRAYCHRCGHVWYPASRRATQEDRS